MDAGAGQDNNREAAMRNATQKFSPSAFKRDRLPQAPSLARFLLRGFIGFTLGVGALLTACNGCRTSGGRGQAGITAKESTKPTLRVYVISDLAGAIEPCGCQKDMLGGVDHFAALVAKEREQAPQSITVSAGPLFFMDEVLKPERAEQDTWKAEAIAAGLKVVGIKSFAPGKNDWSAGSIELSKLKESAGAELVASNLSGAATAGSNHTVIRDIAGVKVAFVGVSSPKSAKGSPDGLVIGDFAEALSREANKARAGGAQIVIGLAAVDRGLALRAADVAKDLDLLAVGSSSLDGDENDKPQPPRFVGPVLVVQPSNHLTRVSIVDFYLRAEGRFADGSGLAHADEVTSLNEQIDLLQTRLANWEKDPAIEKKDLEDRRHDLSMLREKLAKADQPVPTPNGNFVRYALADVRESFGKEPTATSAMKSYYLHVNEFNKTKFAGKRAPAPTKGEPSYVGIDVCKTCHVAAFDVWSKTSHGHAYKTLSDASKEFNLDCVGCHVTGFEKPGGSTVTDVSVLKDVQCEQCHGAGSKHVREPYGNPLADGKDEQICTACHHPPHTDIFDYKSRIEKVRGPGHGLAGAPVNVDPPTGWVPPKARF
ncbi:MAG: hypothetical protein NVSMB1_03690 [Polyangiales bacterium]